MRVFLPQEDLKKGELEGKLCDQLFFFLQYSKQIQNKFACKEKPPNARVNWHLPTSV